MSTAQLLHYKGYTTGSEPEEADAVCSSDAIAYWSHPVDPQPDQAQLDAWAAEPGYATWLAEHGGDPLLTLRRQAKEALDDSNDDTRALIRALALTVLDEINLLRDAHSGEPRTPAQLRTAIKAKLTAGEADN